MILVPITTRATGHAQPVVELVGDGGVADPAVAGIVGRLDRRLPIGARVVAVVPAVGDRRVGAQVRVAREDLLGERIIGIAVQVVLQDPRVHLAAEPDEPLHRVDLLVRLRRLVLHGVVDVVDRGLGAPAVRHLRPAGDGQVGAGVRVVRVHPRFAGAAHRQPDVVALARARDGHVQVGHHARVPEVPHVVGVRGPWAHAEELAAGLTRVVARADDGVAFRVPRVDAPGRPVVELRAPALIRPVVLPAEVAVHEVELAVEPLPILVLVVR